MTTGEKVLEIAKTQLGQQEQPKGSNWGEPVKTYLKSVGITFPASWCMAFVYWCYNQLPNNKMFKSGGVLNVWNNSKQNRVTGDPLPGDVFIMDFGKGLGHTGIVEKSDAEFIYTIEGNTNDEGSREGYEVCRRKRAKSKIKGYLRYT